MPCWSYRQSIGRHDEEGMEESYLELCELKEEMCVRLNDSSESLKEFVRVQERDLSASNEVRHHHGRGTRCSHGAMHIDLTVRSTMRRSKVKEERA
jgi:hypothetical protein